MMTGLIFTARRIKKSQEIKTQKSNHPYYNICDNLHYYSIRFTHILYPVNQIEEKYRKSKKAIEKEWTKYSENAFTNILFRFKPINVYVNFDYKLRLFIEIDYKECFPDYPELLNIEQQTEPFIQNLLSYYRYDEPIYPDKTRIKDYITELLSDRIPDMINSHNRGCVYQSAKIKLSKQVNFQVRTVRSYPESGLFHFYLFKIIH